MLRITVSVELLIPLCKHLTLGLFFRLSYKKDLKNLKKIFTVIFFLAGQNLNQYFP